MDCTQRSHLLNWTYFYQDKCMDELRQSLVLTMELEETRLKAQEELRTRDEQISHLKELLNKAIKERDEAQENCQKMLLEKLILQQQLQQSSGVSSIEDGPPKGTNNNNNNNNNDSNNGFSSSDSDESIVSSPYEAELPLVADRPLPEKGKLLQAVMKAGPLLQTLLLAGPLPQWRHPPPPIDAYQIPPPPLVIPSPPKQPAVAGINCRKRGLSDGSDSSIELKYQWTVLQ